MWLLLQFLQEQQRAGKLSVHPQLEKPVFDRSEEISRDPLIGGVREEILGRLPNATLRDVHGPHLLLQAKPTECADLILSFVGQCSSAKV